MPSGWNTEGTQMCPGEATLISAPVTGKQVGKVQRFPSDILVLPGFLRVVNQNFGAFLPGM